jgi:hypothetical protein
MEVAGYVCNDSKCDAFGSARYQDRQECGCEIKRPCPVCGKDRTILPVYEEPVEYTGPKMRVGVKLDNGKYYG